MQTDVSEINDRVYRFETTVELPDGAFGFNQFLIDAEEPLLFHTGPKMLFPAVSEAVSRVVPLERLRWISFGHLEGDECGSLNQWLAAAPDATAVHSPLGCELGVIDFADRAPRELPEGEVLDLGGRSVRLISTPHVPHNWETVMLFEETTRTLLCGDLGSNFSFGSTFADGDVVEAAFAMDSAFGGVASLSVQTGERIRGLVPLEPSALGIMHGASYSGDCATVLRALASAYDERVASRMPAAIAG